MSRRSNRAWRSTRHGPAGMNVCVASYDKGRSQAGIRSGHQADGTHKELPPGRCRTPSGTKHCTLEGSCGLLPVKHSLLNASFHRSVFCLPHGPKEDAMQELSKQLSGIDTEQEQGMRGLHGIRIRKTHPSTSKEAPAEDISFETVEICQQASQ